MARAYRSVTRGIGPGRQSLPLDAELVAQRGLPTEPVNDGGPVNPTAFAIIGLLLSYTGDRNISRQKCAPHIQHSHV